MGTAFVGLARDVPLSIAQIAFERESPIVPGGQVGGMGHVTFEWAEAAVTLDPVEYGFPGYDRVDIVTVMPLHPTMDESLFRHSGISFPIDNAMMDVLVAEDVAGTILAMKHPLLSQDRGRLEDGRQRIYSMNTTENGPEHYIDNLYRYDLASRGGLMTVLTYFAREQLAPDIIHAHDYHTALVPYYMRRNEFAYPFEAFFPSLIETPMTSFLTLHDVAVSGWFTTDWFDRAHPEIRDEFLRRYQDHLASILPISRRGWNGPGGEHVEGIPFQLIEGASPDLQYAITGNHEIETDGGIRLLKAGIGPGGVNRGADGVQAVSTGYGAALLDESYGNGPSIAAAVERGTWLPSNNGVSETRFPPPGDPDRWLREKKPLRRRELLESFGLPDDPDSMVLVSCQRLAEGKGWPAKLQAIRNILNQALSRGDPLPLKLLVMTRDTGSAAAGMLQDLANDFPQAVAWKKRYDGGTEVAMFEGTDAHILSTGAGHHPHEAVRLEPFGLTVPQTMIYGGQLGVFERGGPAGLVIDYRTQPDHGYGVFIESGPGSDYTEAAIRQMIEQHRNPAIRYQIGRNAMRQPVYWRKGPAQAILEKMALAKQRSQRWRHRGRIE